MKKILTSLLVLTMLVCCLSISAFAANRADFTIDDASGKPGDTVTFNVNIANNQGIAAGKVTVTCDELTITEIAQGSWSVHGADLSTIGKGTSNAAEGIYNWYNEIEVSGDGIYCTYTATINSDVAPGTYTIHLTASDLAGVAVDENGESKVVPYDEGQVQNVEATLTVEGEPAPAKEELAITADPQDVTVKEDEKASFSVTAKGEGLTYQWQKKVDGEWVNVEGATEATYEIEKTALTDAGEYRVVVTDKDGEKAESKAAKLTVNKKEEGTTPTPIEEKKLTIKADPKDAKVKEGEKATFKVEADGEGVTYQWQYLDGKEWKNIDGETKDTLVITTKATDDGTQYRVVVADKNGNKLESKAAKLTVEKKADDTKKDDTKKDDTTKTDDTKKDSTAKTGDNTNLYIYMALCMFAAAVIVGVSYELKKSRD